MAEAQKRPTGEDDGLDHAAFEARVQAETDVGLASLAEGNLVPYNTPEERDALWSRVRAKALALIAAGQTRLNVSAARITEAAEDDLAAIEAQEGTGLLRVATNRVLY